MTILRAGTIHDDAALLDLVPDWWGLWRRCPVATPFQTPAWLVAWWACFRPGPLRVVTVRADGRLVGLAPFYLAEGPGVPRLLPLGISISDYLDVLVDPASVEAWPAMLGELARHPGGPVRIDCEELAPDAAALSLPLPSGWRDAGTAQSACPVLELPDRIEDLAGVIPTRRHRKLRMARRRTARRGGRIDRTGPATVDRTLDALARLHGERWRSRGEAGVLADAVVRRFHAMAVPDLAGQGLIRLTTLSFGETVAGVYYGFANGWRAYAYLGGFDPAFAYESPGAVLLGHAIESAMREGAREFHFLRGQEPYKYEWGARDRWNSRRVMESGA